ncbi:hypothetical protein EVAR_23760_1 [Eumeta japonica]|uniref:Uncharacterized protein n=1 Tax=Eumeta variegata TaxID=151549 RepID=A0A4C1VGX1_EUMVA|nr:hypothetical protein EVAR_23760_1 [Eumeta japonica]
MMDMGTCKPSKSPGPARCMVPKDGQIRPCGDYRRLNAVTKPDRILCAPLRCQSTTAYSGARRSSAEAKCWRGYLRHNAHMRSATPGALYGAPGAL